MKLVCLLKHFLALNKMLCLFKRLIHFFNVLQIGHMVLIWYCSAIRRKEDLANSYAFFAVHNKNIKYC